MLFLDFAMLICVYVGCTVSTKSMRNDGGIDVIKKAIEKLSLRHKEHISSYGEGNERRLTGRHETADIGTFSWVMLNYNSTRTFNALIPPFICFILWMIIKFNAFTRVCYANLCIYCIMVLKFRVLLIGVLQFVLVETPRKQAKVCYSKIRR